MPGPTRPDLRVFTSPAPMSCVTGRSEREGPRERRRTCGARCAPARCDWRRPAALTERWIHFRSAARRAARRRERPLRARRADNYSARLGAARAATISLTARRGRSAHIISLAAIIKRPAAALAHNGAATLMPMIYRRARPRRSSRSERSHLGAARRGSTSARPVRADRHDARIC